MAAGFRTISVFESKHNTGFNHRGTGIFNPNDYVKERASNTYRARTAVSTVRETRNNDVSELPSALFELELGEEDEACVCSEEKTAVVQRLEALLEPLTSLERRVTNDVDYLVLRHKHRQSRPHEPTDNNEEYQQSALATDLQSLGYQVAIRQSVGGGVGSEAVNNLHHTFLRVIPPNSDRMFIVDPKFNEQFDIAHSTASYKTTFQFIPKLLVLREDRIVPLVQLICEELAESFNEMRRPLPPWRKAESLLSKWLPKKSMDVSLPKVIHEPTTTSTTASIPIGCSMPARSTTSDVLTGSLKINRGIVPERHGQTSVRVQAW